MTFGKLGNTYRGEDAAQIKAGVPALVEQLDAAIMIRDQALRRATLRALFDNASHNQRVILTEAAIELLASYPVKRLVRSE